MAELAKLYHARWQVEVNFRYLNTTLRMKSLKCRSVDGVLKENLAIALVYNLVRLVMLETSAKLRTRPDRIGFLDALRWLTCPNSILNFADLKQLPIRLHRIEPRRLKMGRNRYPWMQKPRLAYRQELLQQRDAA